MNMRDELEVITAKLRFVWELFAIDYVLPVVEWLNRHIISLRLMWLRRQVRRRKEELAAAKREVEMHFSAWRDHIWDEELCARCRRIEHLPNTVYCATCRAMIEEDGYETS